MAQLDVALGVDIGGTNTVFGYVDRSGRVLSESSILTQAREPASVFFKRLHAAAETLLDRIKEDCRLIGIGIGAPNANHFKCTIEAPPNLSWVFVDVATEMKQYYAVPVSLTNDANAAALGEMLFGAAKGMRDFIVITLGTGVGSGLVANGEMIYGADSFAGEIGHTTVDPNGRMCGCGRRGCLETYASAKGICRTMLELMCDRTDPSSLRSISPDELTSHMIFDAAQQRDTLAAEAFEITGRILGAKLAESVAHTSPEAIVLVGGLAAAGDLIFKPTMRSLEEHLLGIFKNKVKIIPSGLKHGNAAVLGASALIWDVLERTKK